MCKAKQIDIEQNKFFISDLKRTACVIVKAPVIQCSVRHSAYRSEFQGIMKQI